ncbi:MAG: hypothetical protein IH991_20275, partial [Planctomycetes bacterium]|nr:hypothetical protein [Planctomycetota bacterium]
MRIDFVNKPNALLAILAIAVLVSGSSTLPAEKTITKKPLAPEFEGFILDFEDDVLHDEDWLMSQPRGTVAAHLAPKSDTGVDVLKLAPGEGINGSQALLVESKDDSMGLPGFWVLKNRSTGGSYDNIYDDRGYLLPRGMRANRLEFWVRFEDGFRAKSAALPNQYPNWFNVHVGTYHHDPAQPGKVRETNNWHFYHEPWLRH